MIDYIKMIFRKILLDAQMLDNLFNQRAPHDIVRIELHNANHLITAL